MKKVLVVDDDIQSLGELRAILDSRFDVTYYQSSAKALDDFKPRMYHLALFDIHMPFYDGFQLYKLTRQMDASIPICFITKDDGYQVSKRALAFQEFLFLKSSLPPGNILAHIDHLLENTSASTKVYEISFISNSLIFKGTPITLTPRECRIMSFLLDHGMKISREILKDFVWEDVYVSDKTLNAHLTNLREKLKDIGLTIQNHRDGYVYVNQKSD